MKRALMDQAQWSRAIKSSPGFSLHGGQTGKCRETEAQRTRLSTAEELPRRKICW